MKTVSDLKKAYDRAVSDGKDVFSIDGYEFYTPYAKYLLMHLNNIKLPVNTPLKSFLVNTDEGQKIKSGA